MEHVLIILGLIVVGYVIYRAVEVIGSEIHDAIFSKKEPWSYKMENPPSPPKSFKERLAERQGLYQPTDKVDTSNPPKNL